MSRYVEITKDGNNYTVNPNATGGGSAIAYAWKRSTDDHYIYFEFDKAPETQEEYLNSNAVMISGDDSITIEPFMLLDSQSYTKNSDTEFSIYNNIIHNTITYVRDGVYDFTIW